MPAPFGIAFYTATSGLTVTSEADDHKFVVEAPSPHPAFQTYVAQATASLGVVWIKAVSGVLENDAYGQKLRAEFDRVAAQLTSRYGAGRKSDVLLDDALWREPKDWMRSIEAGERVFGALWQKQDCPGLPEDVSSIYLGVAAVDGDSGSLILEYASPKAPEVAAEIAAAHAALL